MGLTPKPTDRPSVGFPLRGAPTVRRGFTLLEVTLVLALIVILGAMAWPSIEAMYGDMRLTAAADQIRARWADARTQAIEEGRPYRFAVQLDGRFRIAPDTSQEWGGGGTDLPPDTDVPPLVVEESLPKGVNFADGTGKDSTDSGDWLTIVRFLPEGNADRDVDIVFESTGYRPVVLHLRGLTGSVSMETLPLGGRP
jgi:prepilin-type N-terminal cleavage/methylation domain-containing protein